MLTLAAGAGIICTWHVRARRGSAGPPASCARRLAEHEELTEHTCRVPQRPRGVRHVVRPSRNRPADGRHGHDRRLPGRTRSRGGQRLDHPPALVGAVVVLRLRRGTRAAHDEPRGHGRPTQGAGGRPQSDGAALRGCGHQLPRRGSGARPPPRRAGRPARQRRAQGRRSSRPRHRRRLRSTAGHDGRAPAARRDPAGRPRPGQRPCRAALHRPAPHRPGVRQRTIGRVRRAEPADPFRRRPPHPPTQDGRPVGTGDGERAAPVPHHRRPAGRVRPRSRPRSRRAGPTFAACAASSTRHPTSR